MNLKSKILYAINKGLNEALELDDFSIKREYKPYGVFSYIS